MFKMIWWGNINNQVRKVFKRHADSKMKANHSKEAELESELEHQRLIEELDDAFMEWRQAQVRFDHALGMDETDYAIITMEASEKRLAMLLKRAKQNNLRTNAYRQLIKRCS
ncbi:DUF2508 family protein [Paenibacillus assamensis]|uniref:DUF2508 family protein n=1 Tax=Paenibacillus assamensis TaxID=311244 RepID=UPI0004296C91|nr:DUF2508 family protein [Paenibacillus assamensis]